MHDFLNVYFVQPWLGDQAVQDVRLEEAVRAKGVERGKAEEELNGIKTTISDNNEKAVTLRKQISELTDEIEIRENIEDGDEELEEEKEERLKLLSTLSSEKFRKEGELDVCIAVNAKIVEQIDPLTAAVEALENERLRMKDDLDKRIAERDRQREAFYDNERKIAEDLFAPVAGALEAADKLYSKINNNLLIYKDLAKESSDRDEKINEDRFTLTERNALRIPLGGKVHEIQHFLVQKLPRITCSFAHYIHILSEIRMWFTDADLTAIDHLKDSLEKEENEMNGLNEHIPKYQKGVDLYTDKLLTQRRQKSLQVELEIRKKRLNELREIRMRQMKEAKEKLEEEAKAAAAATVKEKKKRVPMATRLAKATKQAIRGVKDFVRDLKHSAETAMDKEEIKMAQTLRKKNKGSEESRPEGVRRLFITHGNSETEGFQRQQDEMEERGIPFFYRMERSFGNQFYLWFQDTFDNKQMITHMELTSTEPDNELYSDPEQRRKDKWEAYTHQDLKMIIYVKRDLTRIKALKGLFTSHSIMTYHCSRK